MEVVRTLCYDEFNKFYQKVRGKLKKCKAVSTISWLCDRHFYGKSRS